MKKRLSLLLAVLLLMSSITVFAENVVGTYYHIYSSYDGIRRVMKNPGESANITFGYIDEEGKIIAECKYDFATDFVNGVSVLKEGKVITAINTKGETVKTFDSSFDIVKYYDGEKGIARKEGLDYLIGKDGKIISKEGYSSLHYDPLSWKNCILAEKGNLYGFIDWQGNILTPIEYRNIFGSKDPSGIMNAQKSNGLYGYIAPNGKIIIPAIYEDASDFTEGIAIVRNSQKAAFINTSGAQITDYIYDNAQNFSEGLGNIMIGTRWGYIDQTGNVVIPATYDNPADFKNGYASIQKADESIIKVESPTKKDRKINVYLNGEWVYLDQEPILQNDRALAPIRGIAEALDYFVTWDAATNTATLQNADKIIQLTVGSKEAFVNTFDDGEPAKTVVLDTQAKLVNGRILIPVRFMAENIGAEVTWDQNSQSINIKTK